MNTPTWRTVAVATLILLSGWVLSVSASESDWFKPLGAPPRASPRRISGGEGFPPLPLPATPLRRSERKRQPSPPSLLGKVIWGDSASFTYNNGSHTDFSDWNLCPADLQSLLDKTRGVMGLSYGSQPINLASFDGDPTRMPVLLFSGVRELHLSPDQIEKLKEYVRRGGMVVFDSVAGSPYFTESARTAAKAMFPQESLRQVPLDHPLFHVVCDASKIRCPRNHPGTTPVFEAIYVGCRAGVLISPIGMGCGWDNHEVPFLPKAVFYDVDSATRLGLDLMAYAIGYAQVGVTEARPELFGARDLKRPTDQFVFAQIVHNGAWNVHPGAASVLLQRLNRETSVKASLRRIPVVLGQDDLSGYSFLYLTGLDDFSFDARAEVALRNFLQGGGTLLINNGLGMATFDAAVRRELTKILPGSHLAPVPLAHPIYRCLFPITTVRYSPMVLQAHHDMDKPTLEGIVINGDLRVIYSPIDLEAGWAGTECPAARTYESQSASELGMNLAMYAVTH